MDYRQIQFCTSFEQIELSQLQELLKLGTFCLKKRRLEELANALSNSEPVVSVWDGEKMIGFARASSDAIYRAIIWEVIIHPDYRGVGLERKLVEIVLSHPRMKQVERVYLMTAERQQFYEQIGFQCNSSTTMMLSNHSLANSYPHLTTEVS